MGAVGASVDVSRANSARAAMQAAVDAAAVILLKRTEGLSGDQLTEKGKNYFDANFARPEVQIAAVTAALSPIPGGSTLTMSATGFQHDLCAGDGIFDPEYLRGSGGDRSRRWSRVCACA
jgi:hypothetical protein